MLIMNKFFRRGIHISLLFIILLPIFTYTRKADSSHNSGNTVKINILSKHLRSLKEIKTGELKFFLPSGSIIRIEDSDFYANSLKILYSDDLYRIFSENRALNFRKCYIHSDNQHALFKVTIDGEERLYPLPLEIIREKKTLKLYVHESPEQYSIDSASSELGYVKPENREALYALAIAIHGRCRINSLTEKHTDSHFCDLTCCQTYKGRSPYHSFTGPFINTSGLSCGLFFHSSSGGRLFTESIFNSSEKKVKPPADILYSENFPLSRNTHKSWQAIISKNEVSEIIFPDSKLLINEIRYYPDREIVSIQTGEGNTLIAPEEFRLKINRRKGWNFIKSNNYTITLHNAEFSFHGSGLGHCTGISIEGALQLAERGYSRYEILEHYYSNLRYLQPGKPDQSYQYVIFSLINGKAVFSSTGPALLNRRIPCGSLFKLFTVIYLGSERRDLFFNYKYRCSDKNPPPLPHHCWDRHGHGQTDIRSALYNSCNLYFASLYDRINKEEFVLWFNRFAESRGISMRLPEIKSNKEWSELLAGLDFRTDISVKDLIKLTVYINNPDNTLPSDASEIIAAALKKTFTEGTAKNSGSDITASNDNRIHQAGLWGKTGTVIAGTNSHHSYGLFTGGLSDTGIIVILRKGKGTEAAHLAMSLLGKNK